ncbi:MAG: zinc ABC transporter substrate-binding protein, partial [Acidaminobacteraceae bacterium]
VEKITMGKAKVITMIPQGYSPENYQPKPSDLEDLSNADIYFTIDVPTESANILPSLRDLNSNIKIADLFDAVADEYNVLSFDLYEEFATDNTSTQSSETTEVVSQDGHDDVGVDTHIWLSPKRVKVMAKFVLDEVILADVENKDFYTDNYNNFIVELDELDMYIKDSLKDQNNKSFIIYHPSLGYYADDYNLNMIAIEENGKTATAKSLEMVIEFSKANDIRVIFYQSEIDSSQVKVIASEVDGEVIEINPLSENIIENLYMMTDTLKSNLK